MFDELECFFSDTVLACAMPRAPLVKLSRESKERTRSNFVTFTEERDAFIVLHPTCLASLAHHGDPPCLYVALVPDE
jgi:hypothetical protein